MNGVLSQLSTITADLLVPAVPPVPAVLDRPVNATLHTVYTRQTALDDDDDDDV